MNLVGRYHQFLVAQEDVPKIALITQFGLYEFLLLPFGLKNAAQTFQQLMNSICADLPTAFVCLDDILVASKSKSEHLQHLQELLQRLADFGPIINPAKYQFGRPVINFLCHHITDRGIKLLQEMVWAVVEYLPPSTLQSLREFLSMVCYFHRFTPSHHYRRVRCSSGRIFAAAGWVDRSWQPLAFSSRHL